MGKLKFSSDLFLEVNELKRLVYFLKDDGYLKLVKSIISSYGIVNNVQNSSFKVRGKLNSTSEVIIEPGLAYDSELNSIELDEEKELALPEGDVLKWIVLSYDTHNREVGKVSIKSDGTLTGVNTKFTEVLRGRTKFPTKVKLGSTINTDDYEVLSVNSDTNVTLAGTFADEENLDYAVVGCFTPGFLPTDENKLIYEYDSSKIEIIESETEPEVDSNHFILASVAVVGSSLSIVDYRSEHIFNSNSFTEQTRLSQNPIMSMLACNNIGYGRIELSLEHGYTISSYNVSEENDIPILRIVTGSCNFLGDGDIADGFFNGWLLLNRKNMKKLLINRNTNKTLYVNTLGSDFLESAGNDLVIVPNFAIIETEVTVNDKKYYFRQSSENAKYFVVVPINSGNNVVTLKYRMSTENDSTPYGNFSISNYTNISGELVSLIDSTFNVNL